jgi:N-acetylmuramoyl-L-alanine amidase
VTRPLPTLLLVAALAMSACSATVSRTPAPSASGSHATSPTPPAATPAVGEVVPAPGSQSEVYAPNPGAIVVAIDPGHGGCLDWGVPNPWDNTRDKAEKADTLAIGLVLRDLLEAQGISVVMTRTDDSALAGDDYPDLGCNGPGWRDVDGDGEAGFEETGRTRTRDELQARIDLVNLARADLVVSLHINSMTQDGVAYEIAATQTFYDDETPWGVDGSGSLSEDVQRAVVTAIDGVAGYDRQDRGTQAVAYYFISRQWADGDTCETDGDTWCKPHRALQLPGILSELGSMSLEAESELLAGDEGRRVVAEGVYQGVRAWIAARQLAVRYDALVPGGEAGSVPEAIDGDGPMYWAQSLPSGTASVPLRLTNTGDQAWPEGLQLLVGWSASDAPYLSSAPATLDPADVAVPPLGPGESVTLDLPLDLPDGGRQLAWITLRGPAGPFSDLGSAPLQLASGG